MTEIWRWRDLGRNSRDRGMEGWIDREREREKNKKTQNSGAGAKAPPRSDLKDGEQPASSWVLDMKSLKHWVVCVRSVLVWLAMVMCLDGYATQWPKTGYGRSRSLQGHGPQINSVSNAHGESASIGLVFALSGRAIGEWSPESKPGFGACFFRLVLQRFGVAYQP